MLLEAMLSATLATTSCQRAVFAFSSGNGAQVPVTICGGLKDADGGTWWFYVDGEPKIVPGGLIFGHRQAASPSPSPSPAPTSGSGSGSPLPSP